ncbi:hypothetical protein [Streptosporangium canum]|uniref:hypothetical protein n=1 Tax=Streptosporangium canum TaxID=324952 RepID=UPI0034338AC9
MIEAARAADDPDELSPDEATPARVVEYTVPARDPGEDGELICLITTILDVRDGPAATLAAITINAGNTKPEMISSRRTYAVRAGSRARRGPSWFSSNSTVTC